MTMSIARSHPGSARRFKWGELYPVLCLIMLATAPAFLLGEENRNLGLIAFMFISPVFVLRWRVSTESLLLLGFAFSIVVFPAFVHPAGARWSTVFYSLMFCALFMSYDGMLRSGFLRISVFVDVVRYLIIAYAIVLVIQQVCVLLGLPIFNVSNYDPTEPWKLNALSSEVSHSARIQALLMLSYIVGSRLATQMGEKPAPSRNVNALVWLCFLWTMLTMVSATAVIMIFIVVLTYATRGGWRNYMVGALLAVVALLLLPDQLIGRVRDLAFAVLTLDYNEVLRADHSGAMRIAPMLVLLNFVELFSAKGLFGHGIDSVSYFMSDYIWGVGQDATGGGLLAVWYEYGFIAFLFFVLFTLKATGALKSPANFIMWGLLIFIAGVNSQIVWLATLLPYTLNVYRQRAEQMGIREQ